MKKEFLECGKIVAPQGIRGEVRVEAWCDPDLLASLETVYMDAKPLKVLNARVQKNMVMMLLEGSDTRDQALTLRGKMLFLHRDDVPLEEGECFVQDLIGCTVLDADTGADYGKIYDVRATGANDVYYLRDAAGKERLVPVIPDVVLEKDLDAEIVRIRPLEGLFDEN